MLREILLREKIDAVEADVDGAGEIISFRPELDEAARRRAPERRPLPPALERADGHLVAAVGHLNPRLQQRIDVTGWGHAREERPRGSQVSLVHGGLNHQGEGGVAHRPIGGGLGGGGGDVPGGGGVSASSASRAAAI